MQCTQCSCAISLTQAPGDLRPHEVTMQCTQCSCDISLTQGVDVIINASSMEDIDPAAIGQRLTNGTAVIASPVLSRLRIREEEQTQPRDEEMRKEEEKRKALEERQRFEDERMELERREQEEREKRYHEREMQIEEHRRQQQSKEVEDVQERTKDQSIFVRESCLSEAAAIIAQRTDNPREYFKQRERAVAVSFDSSPLSSHRAEIDITCWDTDPVTEEDEYGAEE
ncbi:UNVERIFIED_CONTAM: hypothetical protein FKN15_076422 [Acipenser sinensis]